MKEKAQNRHINHDGDLRDYNKKGKKKKKLNSRCECKQTEVSQTAHFGVRCVNVRSEPSKHCPPGHYNLWEEREKKKRP